MRLEEEPNDEKVEYFSNKYPFMNWEREGQILKSEPIYEGERVDDFKDMISKNENKQNQDAFYAAKSPRGYFRYFIKLDKYELKNKKAEAVVNFLNTTHAPDGKQNWSYDGKYIVYKAPAEGFSLFSEDVSEAREKKPSVEKQMIEFDNKYFTPELQRQFLSALETEEHKRATFYYLKIDDYINDPLISQLAELQESKEKKATEVVSKQDYIERAHPDIKWESLKRADGSISQLKSPLMTKDEAATTLEHIYDNEDNSNREAFKTVPSRSGDGFRIIVVLDELKEFSLDKSSGYKL